MGGSSRSCSCFIKMIQVGINRCTDLHAVLQAVFKAPLFQENPPHANLTQGGPAAVEAEEAVLSWSVMDANGGNVGFLMEPPCLL